MASTYLQRNTTQSASSSTTATISVWVKLASVTGNYNMGIFGTHNDNGDYSAGGNSQIGFYNGGLYAWFKDGTNTYFKQESTRRFRDTNAWYHLVYRFDLTESTASNRIRVYVNNEEITSWSTTNDPPNNVNIQIQKLDRNQRIGAYNFTSGTFVYMDGCMSHFHLCDGQSYAPTEFGEYDANGVWKIKTETSVTYGNNGFFILKDGNSVTDQSGNGNNFTVAGGTLTNTEDSPSNVFCVLNALDKKSSLPLTNGNNAVDDTSNTWGSVKSTIGFSSGKYYAEAKIIRKLYASVGVARTNTDGTNQSSVDQNKAMYKIYSGGSIEAYIDNVSFFSETSIGEASVNDIIGIAIDCDNGTLTFYKNGTQIGSTVTSSNISNYEWTFACQVNGSGFEWNFGNGYFGTTPVASAGTNASGNGIFEYDVPTGYTALSTKGLNL